MLLEASFVRLAPLERRPTIPRLEGRDHVLRLQDRVEIHLFRFQVQGLFTPSIRIQVTSLIINSPPP